MFLNEVYFWTDTIKNWKHLLKRDEYKQIIIEQIQWLVVRKKIEVYGYVFMPNHIHLIWKLIDMNGKEMPHASFNKWTSKSFLKDLRNNHPDVLIHFVEKVRKAITDFGKEIHLQYLWIPEIRWNKNSITFI